VWFAKTSAGTRNGAVLGGVGLNAIIVSIRHGDTRGQEPERWSTHLYKDGRTAGPD
jgi:hypothetical protein